MDDARFDHFTRALSAAGTRRGLLGLLITLPGFGGLADSVAAGDVDAAGGRRKLLKKRHKHGKGRRRKGRGNEPQPCRPESQATTCADRCGSVKNNCKATVDCGSCQCEPACPACQVCNEVAGTCLPDPTQEGEGCGPGQFCRDDGTCRCEATSCAACETCHEDGICSAPCGGEGCCAEGGCLPGDTIEACGIDGESCQVCAQDELCWNGRCVCGDVCSDGCQFSTIREAIDAVEPGATLRLCAESYPRPIHITRSLTLLGVGDGEDGTVLDGQGEGRASTVSTSRDTVVTLQGLRITGGSRPDSWRNGGGIHNPGTLTLLDCTVTGNVAAGAGGGIYNDGGNLTLRNSHVTGNAGVNGGGGIYSAFETLTLENCVVSNNTARRGGGIFALGTVELNNTEVTHNVAQTREGGGILTGGTLRLTNCQVTGNTSPNQGGGIHNSGTLTLTNSQVATNRADEGGGIFNELGTVTLIDSAVEDNTPDNCAGEPVVGCSG